MTRVVDQGAKLVGHGRDGGRTCQEGRSRGRRAGPMGFGEQHGLLEMEMQKNSLAVGGGVGAGSRVLNL